jgi:hypothetical protein
LTNTTGSGTTELIARIFQTAMQRKESWMSRFISFFISVGLAVGVLGVSALKPPATIKPGHMLPSSVAQTRLVGAEVCASPPANFSPLKATPAEIAYYGLPVRPINSKDIPRWLSFVEYAKHRDCGSVGHLKYPVQHHLDIIPKHKPGVKYHFSNTSSRSNLPTNDSSANWSGVVDYRTTSDGVRFRDIQGWLQTDCEIINTTQVHQKDIQCV